MIKLLNRVLMGVVNRVGKVGPAFIKELLVYIPFKYRYGSAYTNFEKLIVKSHSWNEDELNTYIIQHFNTIFQYSKKFKLYQDKYEKSGVMNLEITSIDDIKKVPILTREEVQLSIADFNGYEIAKTGGTTGNPLHIYLDENVWAREWAHYHYIWGKLGYKFTDTNFIFREVNNQDEFLKFDFNHNTYIVNIYKIHSITVEEIKQFFKILTQKNVKYFHGYPSAINDFLREIEDKVTNEQSEILQKQIECCFFSSEYPTPQIVKYIQEVWNLDFVSCYGHTETCVLAAADKNNLAFKPLHTYGFVEIEDGKLLGTSFHNFDMPLIRYNTNDIAIPKYFSNGILESFEIKEGRNFYYIIDKKNIRISIIDIIDKMHPEIFDHVQYIQMYQETKGEATILVSQKKSTEVDLIPLMNLKNLNLEIDFSLMFLEKPIKTMSGKVSLRVQKLP